MKLHLRYTISIFSIIIIALIVLYLNKERFLFKEKEMVQPKLVIPKMENENFSQNEESYQSSLSQLSSTMSGWASDEMVLSMQMADINADGFEDQIVAVRRSGGNTIFMVLGLYNQKTSLYDRSFVIDTEITQSTMFSFLIMDVLGDHSNALVFSGMNATSETLLKVFLIKTVRRAIKLEKIADFVADENVYINQIPRSDAYQLYRSPESPYKIHLIQSDASKGITTLDRIESIYEWNDRYKKYVKVNEIKIAGKQIAEKELAKIQDGKVETFENFINGLWYKISGNNSERYIFFNLQEKEIVFLEKDIQEVYLWQNSMLRRNGLYLSSINNSISNLTRRFDISLSSIDEIKIKINDDVKMIIGEETLWDGTYRKWMNNSSLVPVKKNTAHFETFNINNYQVWAGFNNKKVILDNNSFEILDELESSKGSLALRQVDDNWYLQFRTLYGKEFLNGYYHVVLAKDALDEKKEILTLFPAGGSINAPIS
ncbi:MAG: pallilysin-related adhesin, partial [Treponemataceae bacterium]